MAAFSQREPPLVEKFPQGGKTGIKFAETEGMQRLRKPFPPKARKSIKIANNGN
ncbi:hypothetical protein LJC04_03940 [Ruminococcaceae bacterium OttesenSCG-928-O06]|nr:hypothetical protein [Ruminococcaceae bacterium OttesenSCG-928-O06]